MNKINILFLAEELRVGGAESYFYKLENNVDRKKYNFYSMAVNGSQFDKIKYPDYFSFYTFSPFNRVRKIKKACLEHNINVIHANSLKLSFAAVIVKKMLKKKMYIKIMYTKHNITFLEKISKKVFVKFLNKNIDVVNSICNVEKRYLIRNGVIESKVHTIYNGTKISDFKFNSNRIDKFNFSIGILARLSSEKRHDIFINVADILSKNVSNVNFYIGGDGLEKDSITKMISKKRLEDKVYMLGNVNASDFLEKIDYLVLVSDREVLPMSIIEGMASGCIVIARNVGGVQELINEDTGFLVDSDEPSKYAEIIENLVNNNFNYEMSLNARKYVEKQFSLDTMLLNIEKQYNELAK